MTADTCRGGRLQPALLAAFACLAALATPAQAQGLMQVRGFADLGSTVFSAAQSFDAVLGSNRGLVIGAGVEVAHPRGVFGGMRVSRFRGNGERVFVFEGDRFPLGVPTVVTVVPVVFTAGYRYQRWPRLSPYGAGGIGLHRYTERSDVAVDDEDVDEVFTGYHLLGGIEVRLSPLIAAAGEAEWTAVPNALGRDPTGVSAAFGENDLGGVTIRVKILIGR
jgi:opacity protein-like surface antigen